VDVQLEQIGQHSGIDGCRYVEDDILGVHSYRIRSGYTSSPWSSIDGLRDSPRVRPHRTVNCNERISVCWTPNGSPLTAKSRLSVGARRPELMSARPHDGRSSIYPPPP
jgi:hypothetical protein